MSLIDRLRAQRGVRHGPSPVGREPALRCAIVSCMDARLDLEEACGLRPGDANLLRNAGAHVTDDVVRSLVVAASLLGVREFAVIAHTGCGLLGLDERAVRTALAGRIPDVEAVALGGFVDLRQHVREQVRALATSPLLPGGSPVSGWIYDLADGSLDEVAAEVTGSG